jgi:hypothetical protein
MKNEILTEKELKQKKLRTKIRNFNFRVFDYSWYLFQYCLWLMIGSWAGTFDKPILKKLGGEKA